jgi:hypothetical protein
VNDNESAQTEICCSKSVAKREERLTGWACPRTGWACPRTGWIKVNTDGAAKGNPVLTSGGGLLGIIDATRLMDFQLTSESILHLKQRRGQLLLA